MEEDKARKRALYHPPRPHANPTKSSVKGLVSMRFPHMKHRHRLREQGKGCFVYTKITRNKLRRGCTGGTLTTHVPTTPHHTHSDAHIQERFKTGHSEESGRNLTEEAFLHGSRRSFEAQRGSNRRLLLARRRDAKSRGKRRVIHANDALELLREREHLCHQLRLHAMRRSSIPKNKNASHMNALYRHMSGNSCSISL